jgi:hypothetical protein
LERRRAGTGGEGGEGWWKEEDEGDWREEKGRDGRGRRRMKGIGERKTRETIGERGRARGWLEAARVSSLRFSFYTGAVKKWMATICRW